GGDGMRLQFLQFSSDFEDFAKVINSVLADPHGPTPWRLQELPKSELTLGGLGLSDRPSWGRRYAVFHNQIRLAEIEVAPAYQYTTETPHVRVYIGLDWVRLLGFGTIRNFLTEIAMFISEYRPGTEEYVETNWTIDRALMGVLWKTQEISQFGMDDEPSH